MPSSSTYAAGLKFRPQEARDVYETLGEADALTLEAEPDNKYDPGAIKVVAADGTHVGYIPRDRDEIRNAFAAGKVTSVEKCPGNKVRVHFDQEEEVSR